MSSTAATSFDTNLRSYWTDDLLSRYGGSSTSSSSESSSFRDALIADLRATGALAPASEEETSSTTTSSTTGATTSSTSTAGATTSSTDASDTSETSETTSATDTTSTTSTGSIPRDNWYAFTTTEWQNSHSYYSDIFTQLPGLSSWLGANPSYGDMLVNDGAGGASAAVNAYLAQSGSSSSSSSTVSTTA